VMGTPAYMSPEAIDGKHIDFRADQYSLGCVLYEMLAGEPPFTGPSARVIIARHVQEPPPNVRIVRPDLPAEIDRLLKKMLAKSPVARFESADRLARALENPTDETIAEPGRRWPRSTARIATLAAAAAALIAILGWWLTRLTAR